MNYKVAIIDDGIKGNKSYDIKADLYVTNEGIVRKRTIEEIICTDHGTICAGIISTYSRYRCFYSLKIFDGPLLMTNVERLVSAMEWCCQNDINIINISLGSTKQSDYEILKRAVNECLYKGIIIVAANDNRERMYAMPACFCGVIGVKTGPILSLCNEEVDLVSVQAPAVHKLIMNDKSIVTANVNSYAAPYVTSQILKKIIHHESAFSLENITREYCCSKSLRPDFLSVAIIFDPLNTIKNEEELAFKVIDKCRELDGLKQCDKRVPIVVASFLGDEYSFWNDLAPFCYDRLGVAYAGVKCNSVFPSHLFWDESVFDIDYSFPIISVKSPSLIILSEEKKGLHFTKKLRSFFQKKGVECEAFSNMEKAYLYGLEYLFCISKKASIIEEFNALHNVSLDLILLDRYEYVTQFEQYYVLWLVDNICGIQLTGLNIYINYEATDNDFESLYKLVIDTE